jgi:tRNA-splicing ligase RtcB
VPRPVPRRHADRPRRADVRQRPDIRAKKLGEIKQEAPFAYKGIGPVVPVAELTPLMTLKG